MIPMRGDKPLIPRNLGAYTFRFDCDRIVACENPKLISAPTFKAFSDAVTDSYRSSIGVWFDYRPLKVDITIMRRLPISRPSSMEREDDLLPPSLNSMARSILTCLEGVAFADQRTIVSLGVVKAKLRRREMEGASVTIRDLS